MIRTLMRLLRGHLICLVRGRNIHRFVNLCLKYRISFWNLEYINDSCMKFSIYLPDVYRLKPFVKKTHVKIKIKEKKGLPFTLHRYRGRVAFVSVILFCVIGISCLSLRIWKIEIMGNSMVSEETLLAYLKGKEVSYGVKKKNIDNDALELQLRQDFDPIIWTSVYQKGTKLVVRVQEKLMSERHTSADTITDLVSKQEATVESIVTRSGTPMVKAGDEVKAGDILVLGRQEIYGDDGAVREYYYEAADADVFGRVTYTYEDWLPIEEEKKIRTGKSHEQYYLVIGDKEIEFPMLYAMYDTYDCIEKVEQFNLMDYFYFPVFLGKTTYYEEKYVPVEYSYEKIKEKAKKNLRQFLLEMEENGVSILDKHVMIEKAGNSYHVYGEIVVSEPIAASALTEILESPVQEQDNE